MQKIEVSIEKSIIWPNKCAMCLADPKGYAITKRNEVTGYYVFVTSHKRSEIAYPVCAVHKKGAKLREFISGLSVSKKLMISFYLPAIIASPLLVLLPEVGSMLFCSLCVLYWVLIFSILKSVPVKIIRHKQNKLELGFKNYEFAEEFNILNNS